MRRSQPLREKPQESPSTLFDHHFRSPELLTRALTHRSLAYETNPETLNDPGTDNEQLEFVGDAVLGLVVADSLFRRFPASREGELTRLRASLVSREHLGKVADRIGLGLSMRFGRGEEQSGGRKKRALLANALEAVIAALYLDGGWGCAADFVLGLLEHRIEESAAGPGAEDFKTRLQEMVVRRVGKLPLYEVAGTGPDHARRYTATVIVGGAVVGQGEGRSKKDAEQAAAHAAFPAFAEPTADPIAEPGDRDCADGGVPTHA